MLKPVVLLAARTTNGTGTAVSVPIGTNALRNAPISLYATGTFNGAVITLEASFDGVTYVPVTGLTITAIGVTNLDISASHLRAIVASVGASTSVTLTAV